MIPTKYCSIFRCSGYLQSFSDEELVKTNKCIYMCAEINKYNLIVPYVLSCLILRLKEYKTQNIMF
eukprot:GAHX01002181.1.p2 GENE.GAHX01002181.1~~GAHX01002181.1.p2  ORF type:complete len:66 (+),score=4.28 GAHX01002181.1:165-362(+)